MLTCVLFFKKTYWHSSSRGEKRVFFIKKIKELFFLSDCQWPCRDAKVLVSEGRLFWFSHRFLFEAYHHHYTPIRCCAQRFGPHLPSHILFGWRQNHKMTKPYARAQNIFFQKRVRKSWALVQASASFSCFFTFRNKNKIQKTRQRKLRKLSSRSNHSSTFAFFGGPENEPPRALWSQHDSNIFPRRDKISQKKSQRFKVWKLSLALALTCT